MKSLNSVFVTGLPNDNVGKIPEVNINDCHKLDTNWTSINV